MLWFLILMGILYVIVNAGLLFLCFRFMNSIGGILKSKVIKIIFAVLYALAASTIFIWLLFDDPDLVYYFKSASNIWIGIFIYLLIWCAAAEILTVFLSLLKKLPKGTKKRIFTLIKGICVCLLVLVLSVYGTIHAKKIYVTEYNVSVQNKNVKTDSLTIVLVADTHIGYSVGYPEMQQMVDRINEQDADLVLFGGDIIDNDFSAIKDADLISETFRSIKSTYGVYGVFGNHDVEEKLLAGFRLPSDVKKLVCDETKNFLKESNIRILEDETVEILPGITLIGRIDEGSPNIEDYKEDSSVQRKTIEELTKNLDQDNYLIDLDHEPSELYEKAAAGIDLDLGGHTHKGQIFPGTLTIYLGWDNAYGIKTTDEMTSVVTSGAGFWGPAMRVDSKSEIAVIHVNFN